MVCAKLMCEKLMGRPGTVRSARASAIMRCHHAPVSVTYSRTHDSRSLASFHLLHHHAAPRLAPGGTRWLAHTLHHHPSTVSTTVPGVYGFH